MHNCISERKLKNTILIYFISIILLVSIFTISEVSAHLDAGKKLVNDIVLLKLEPLWNNIGIPGIESLWMFVCVDQILHPGHAHWRDRYCSELDEVPKLPVPGALPHWLYLPSHMELGHRFECTPPAPFTNIVVEIYIWEDPHPDSQNFPVKPFDTFTVEKLDSAKGKKSEILKHSTNKDFVWSAFHHVYLTKRDCPTEKDVFRSVHDLHITLEEKNLMIYD